MADVSLAEGAHLCALDGDRPVLGGDSSDICCRGCIVMHLGRGLGAVWVVLAVLFTPEGVLACTLVVGCVPLGLVGWR